MSQVIDELITKFTLDGKSWVSEGDKVSQASLAITARIKQAGKAVEEFGHKLNERFKISDLFEPLKKLTTLPGLVDFGKDAANVALRFDDLERKITEVTGSLQRARQIMTFSDHLSSTLPGFSPEELDKAALRIEAFGMKTEQVLPTVQKLASVFGDSAGDIDKYVQALGKLYEGDSADALNLLKASGIGTKELAKQGVRVENGKMVGNPDQTVAGIGRAVDAKYGGELAAAADSPASKVQALHNAWDNALASIGNSILTVFAEPMKRVAEILDKWVQGGQISQLTQSFLGLFGVDSNNLVQWVGTLGRLLDDLPGTLQRIKHDFGPIITEAAGAVRNLLKLWESLPGPVRQFGLELGIVNKATGGLLGNLLNLGGPKILEGLTKLKDLITGISKASSAASAVSSAAGAGSGIAGSAASGATGAATVGIGARIAGIVTRIGPWALAAADVAIWKYVYDEIQDGLDSQKSEEDAAARPVLKPNVGKVARDFNKWLQSHPHKQYRDWIKETAEGRSFAAQKQADADAEGQGAVASSAGGDDLEAMRATQFQGLDHLRNIDANTREASLDLKRYALGGGELGQIGVSPVDMAAIRGSSGGHAHAVRKIFEGINDITTAKAYQVAQQSIRAGY